MAASDKYVSRSTAEPEAGDRSVDPNVCRRSVRSLQAHAILTPEWIAMIDTLETLAKWTKFEEFLPADVKTGEAQGRNVDSVGTLWDQARSENTIRILVEEAKVNLCMRMMHDFKRWQYSGEKQQSIQKLVVRLGYGEPQLEAKCNIFEQSLGLLMTRGFMHVETLQLTDIPLLIEHCVLVFQHVKRNPGAHPLNPKAQEIVVLHYFASLMRSAEALNRTELLAKTRELCLVQLAIDHVLDLVELSQLSPEASSAVVDGFAGLADNEDFQTDWEGFFDEVGGASSAEPRKLFLKLEEKIVAPILSETPSRRASLRPLLDFFRVVERSLK